MPPISLPREVGSFGGLALIGDVAEEMALRVLRPRTSQVRSDTPVDRRRPFLAVALDGHAANEHDTPTVDELARDAFELGAECREREVVTRDVEHVVTCRLGVHERGVELLEMRIGELEHVGVAELVAAPFARGLERC